MNIADKEQGKTKKKDLTPEVKFDTVKWGKILQKSMQDILAEIVEHNGEAAMSGLNKFIKKELIIKGGPGSGPRPGQGKKETKVSQKITYKNKPIPIGIIDAYKKIEQARAKLHEMIFDKYGEYRGDKYTTYGQRGAITRAEKKLGDELRKEYGDNSQEHINIRTILQDYFSKGNKKQKSFQELVTKAENPLLDAEGNVQLRFDALNPNVTQFVNDRSFRFSFDVNEYTQRELKSQLNRGFEEGESIPTIKERIKMLFGFGENKEGNYRAQRIARSEVIRASNYGQEQAYIQSGVVDAKEWVAAFDDRTCPYCSKMDGRIIGLGQNFFNRGDTFQGLNLNYEDIKGPPLHPSCRCTLVPIVNEELLGERAIPRPVIREEAIPDGSPFAIGKIIEEQELITGTLNECALVKIDGDGKGIYKNERQERLKQKRYYRSASGMMNLDDCSMVQREVLASEIDKILGWDLVPETVLKKGIKLKTVGSTQQFIDGYRKINKLPFNTKWNELPLVIQQDKLMKISVFDDLVANIDRHEGNIGFGASGELKLIDNGASFAHTPQKAWNGRFIEDAGYNLIAKYFGEVYRNAPRYIRASEKYVETAKEVGAKMLNDKIKINGLFKGAKLPKREIDAFWERAKAMAVGKFAVLEEKTLRNLGYI